MRSPSPPGVRNALPCLSQPGPFGILPTSFSFLATPPHQAEKMTDSEAEMRTKVGGRRKTGDRVGKAEKKDGN